MYSRFPKGSEWRKWDLQVCTKEYCNYKGPALDKEALDSLAELSGVPKAAIQSNHKSLSHETYAAVFVEYLARFTDLAVVAITNHNTGDGIQAIVDYLAKRQAEVGGRYTELFVFPGVEIGASDRCHILAVFNPDTTCAKRHAFDQAGHPTARLTWDQYINKFLSEIGLTAQRFHNGKPDNSPTKSTYQILEVCEDWDFLPIFPHIQANTGWYSELPDNLRHETFRHRNFGIVDSKNIGNNQDLRLILDGRKKEYGEKVIAQIATSDASSLTDLGKHATWIKADPTFAGLRQIMFEPQERVCVTATRPASKRTYFVVDRVRFLPSEGSQRFDSEWIELSPGLNAIIGGKSTGKSLLLHHIAKTIDAGEVERRNSGEAPAYTLDADDPRFSFQVAWHDGEVQKLSAQSAASSRKLLYIPQGFLCRLTERDTGGRKAINDFIFDVLQQFPEVKELSGRHDAEKDLLERRFGAEIGNLFSLREELKAAAEEVKTLGDAQGVENYIKQLQAEIEEIKRNSGFAPDELTAYEALTNEETTLGAESAQVAQDAESNVSMAPRMRSAVESIAQIHRDWRTFLADPAIQASFDQGFSWVASLQGNFDAAWKALDETINKRREDLALALKDVAERRKPYLSKEALQGQLETKTEQLRQEQDKLERIRSAVRTQGKRREAYEKKQQEILSLYASLGSKYGRYAEELKKHESKLEDISLGVTVCFDEARFNSEVIDQFLNKADVKQALIESRII